MASQAGLVAGDGEAAGPAGSPAGDSSDRESARHPGSTYALKTACYGAR